MAICCMAGIINRVHNKLLQGFAEVSTATATYAAALFPNCFVVDQAVHLSLFLNSLFNLLTAKSCSAILISLSVSLKSRLPIQRVILTNIEIRSISTP